MASNGSFFLRISSCGYWENINLSVVRMQCIPVTIFLLVVERRLQNLSADRLNSFHLALCSEPKQLLLFSDFPTLIMLWTLENPRAPDSRWLTSLSTPCMCVSGWFISGLLQFYSSHQFLVCFFFKFYFTFGFGLVLILINVEFDYNLWMDLWNAWLVYHHTEDLLFVWTSPANATQLKQAESQTRGGERYLFHLIKMISLFKTSLNFIFICITLFLDYMQARTLFR